MSNIHPFDRAKEFPNYFEIMLKSVPEEERDAFVKKIQKLIEQNISAILKRLKLYYVNDQGELSTADYFNELVKSMEHALKESPAKDSYELEVYASGGVVRTLLSYVYKQLHIKIQEVLESETELTQLPIANKKDFFKNFTKTPEFWLQKLKTEKSKLQNSYVLGVGSDMDILYKLSPRTSRHGSKLNDAQLEKLHEALWDEKTLNKAQKKALDKAVKEQTLLNEAQLKDLHQAIDNQTTFNKAKLEKFRQAIDTTMVLDEKQLQELFHAVKNKTKLSQEQLKDLCQAIDNQRTLDKPQSQSLYQAIEAGGELNEEQLDNLQKAIENHSKLNAKELQKSYQATKSQHKLNEAQLQALHQAIDNQNKLNKQALQESHPTTEDKNTLDDARLGNLGEKIRQAGDTFINSASNFFNLGNVEETLKNSLLPPGDVNEYNKQTKKSMTQGGSGSALDWLAFELSPKTGQKLIEPPSAFMQQENKKLSIVKDFIFGHYEYLELQTVGDQAGRTERTVRAVRGLRPLFEIPFLTIKDEAVILREIQRIESLDTRNVDGNIVLPPNALKQLEKLRRNTNFEGAHNRAQREPKGTALSTFLEMTKRLPPEADGRMATHLPKYLQVAKSVDKSPATGTYQSEINNALVDPKTFIADFTDAGMLYHGTPLNAVTAIVRGGFYISDSTQGMAVYGSGLYSTKDRAVALGYSESVLLLHIDTDKAIKIINLDNMNSQAPTLLQKLQDEATQGGFLDVNELLKTRYNIDVIIHAHVLIQNAAVIKPIQLSDLSVTYGTQFETQFMSHVQLGDKSFHLISENINVADANKFFEHYTNLCLLSGTVETDSLSPVKIIKSLVAHVEKIENTQPIFNLQNTRLFIYLHCFSAKPDYVMAHLTDIFKYSNNNPDIMKALEKFTQGFATSFKKGTKEGHEALVAILKNLILYANTNDLIIRTLNALKQIEPQALIGALNELISSAEITQTQALYFLAKIDNKELQKTYLTLLDLERPENEKRLAELSAVRALTIDEIYKQHPKEISENINMQDAQGNTYLLNSCSTGTDEDIRKISELHADLNFFDKNGKTALWMAIENKNITDECIIEMIKNSNIDLGYIYKNETPILSACIAKRDTLVAYFLSNHGVNLNIQKNGLSILHLAGQNGLQKTITLLLTKHSDMFNLNQLDNNLNTPLMLAIKSDQHEVIKTLVGLQATTNILIDLDVKNNGGFSALDIAAQKGDKELIEYLFAEKRKQGSEYSADALSSALMHAILNKQEGAVEILLNILPAQNLNYVNANGMTLLAAAVESGQLNVALKIVKKAERPIESDTYNVLKKVYALKNQYKNDVSLTLFNLMLEKKYNDINGAALTLASSIGDMANLVNMSKQLKYSHMNLLHALESACTARKYDAVLHLLECENTINASNITPEEQTILDNVFITAAKYNSIDIINKLLDSYRLKEPILAQVLITASTAHHHNVVLHLLEQDKIDSSNIDPGVLDNVLTNAANDNSINVVNKLLEKYKFSEKVSMEVLRERLQRENMQNSSSNAKTLKDAEEIALSILKVCKVENSTNFFHDGHGNFDGSLLDFSCYKKMDKLALALLEKTSDLNKNLRGNLKSSLIYACENGLKKIVTKMIERNINLDQTFRVDTQDRFGRRIIGAQTTPLLAALMSGNPDIALTLIRSGTKNFHVRFAQVQDGYSHLYSGNNALDIAMREGHIEVANEIIKKTLEQNIELYSNLDGFKHTLQMAALSGDLELIDLIIDSHLYKNKDAPLKLEDCIESIYSILDRNSGYRPDSKLRSKVITHLLERSFLYPENLYHSAIRDKETDVLLKIFETKKEYLPDNQEKKFMLLDKIGFNYNSISSGKKEKIQYSKMFFALLEKGYLNLDTIKQYQARNGKYKFDSIFYCLNAQALKDYPKLVVQLTKDEYFDKYFDFIALQQLKETREIIKTFLDFCSKGTDSDIHTTLTSHPDLNLNIFDEDGNTPLSMMIKNPNITDEHIIEIIKEHKIDLENISNNQYGCKSAILSACIYKRDALATHLMSNHNINLNAKTWFRSNILELACENGLQETLRSLITNHANMFHLNQVGSNGNTPLMTASIFGLDEIIKTLFDLQSSTNTLIDLDLKNQDGFSSLDMAAQYGNKAVIDHLFSEKKKRNSEYNVDALSSALMQAILNKKEGVIKMLLNSLPAQNLNYVNYKGSTLLETALENNKLDVALEIARKSDQPVENKTDNVLKKVYIFKNQNKQNDVSLTLFNLMLQKKYTDAQGETLILASQNGNIESVASMSQQLNYERKDLLNAAMAASDAKENSTVLYLLEHIHKTNPNNISHAEQEILDKIFLNAIENDSVDIINKLLAQYTFSDKLLYSAVYKMMKRADVVRSYGSNAPTQQAEEITLSILLKIENSKNFFNPYFTADFGSILDFACYKKMDKLALALLERTSDLSKDLREHSKSALFYASENGLTTVVATMMKKNVEVDQLFMAYNYETYLKHGLQLTRRTITTQTTPLLEALVSGHPDIALVLLEAGVKNFSIQYLVQNSRNSFYHAFNGLSIAIEKGYIEVAKEIIKKAQEQNIEVYERLDNLIHALQLASLSGSLELIDLMIDSPLFKDQKDPLKLLEDSIMDIYNYSWQRRRVRNSELSAKTIIHLLERPFICPKALYEQVIKNMDTDTLLKLFETRREFVPNDQEQKLALLEKLNASYREINWRNDERKTQYLNIVLELLEKEYLDLNSVENYLKSGRDTSGNLWSVLGWNLKTTHLNSHPKLAIALAKRDSFDQYLNHEVCQKLLTIRQSLSKEEGLPLLKMHYTREASQGEKGANETPKSNSPTNKSNSSKNNSSDT